MTARLLNFPLRVRIGETTPIARILRKVRHSAGNLECFWKSVDSPFAIWIFGEDGSGSSAAPYPSVHILGE